MRTDSSKNEILKGHLETLCKCYSTGRFDNLFPLLADDCVFESQWVLTPNTGKAAVVDYFLGKGATLRKNDCCPTCTIVELVGNLNTIKNAEVHRHTISDDSIEDCERKVRISVFPFELSVYKDMDAFNKWAGFGDGKEVGNTGLKVGGFSETFAMPGGMFKEKADDESYSFLVGRVKSFRDVQVSFGEISWDFVLANVYTALGTVPVAMGREVFDLSALEPEVIVAMNADVKADMSKPEDFTYPKKQ